MKYAVKEIKACSDSYAIGFEISDYEELEKMEQVKISTTVKTTIYKNEDDAVSELEKINKLDLLSSNDDRIGTLTTEGGVKRYLAKTKNLIAYDFDYYMIKDGKVIDEEFKSQKFENSIVIITEIGIALVTTVNDRLHYIPLPLNSEWAILMLAVTQENFDIVEE